VRKSAFETRLFFLALAAGAPAVAVASVFLWTSEFSRETCWTLVFLIAGVWIGLAIAIRAKVIFEMQTLSNLVGALREGDFSVRPRSTRRGEGLTELIRELNRLSDTLHRERIDAVEAGALLRKVMQEIDVAVFAFDAHRRLRLVNPAGEKLLLKSAAELLGQKAVDVQLEEFLDGETRATLTRDFPGGRGRWAIHRASFREKGRPHDLLVISDVSRPLREQEREAWQRLIRVLGHELNNSLTPIKSIAGSLGKMLSQEELPPGWREDMRRGLHVVASRTAALSRFTASYSKLARLPSPRPARVDLEACIRSAADLETRMAVIVTQGPAVSVLVDRDQIEQVLINLLRNAVDAARETGGKVGVDWKTAGGFVEISIRDEGPGLPSPENLFVPFFTTKPNGSGIGLVLSRQIVEAHSGTLVLQNRADTTGCCARVMLPLHSKAAVESQ